MIKDAYCPQGYTTFCSRNFIAQQSLTTQPCRVIDRYHPVMRLDSPITIHRDQQTMSPSTELTTRPFQRGSIINIDDN